MALRLDASPFITPQTPRHRVPNMAESSIPILLRTKDKQHGFNDGWWILLSCSLISLAGGIFTTYGNLLAYHASVMTYWTHPQSEQAYAENCNFFSKIYYCMVFTEGIGFLCTGPVVRKLGTIKTLVFSSALIAGGYTLTYFCTDSKLSIVTLGVMVGFGVGIGYAVFIVTAIRNLPEPAGLANGIVVGIFGLTPLIADIAQMRLINPEGLPIDPLTGYSTVPSIADNYQRHFLIVGAAISILYILALLILVWKLPVDCKDDEEEGVSAHGGGSSVTTDVQHALTLEQALQTWQFWWLFLMSVCNFCITLFFYDAWKQLCVEYWHINDDAFLARIGALSGVVSAIGRCLWSVTVSWTQDARRSYIYNCVCLAITLSSFCLVARVTSGVLSEPLSKLVVATGVFATYGVIGGGYAFTSMMVMDTFGEKYAVDIISMLFVSEIPCAALGMIIFNSRLTMGWFAVSMELVTGAVICIILLLVYDSKVSPRNTKGHGVSEELLPGNNSGNSGNEGGEVTTETHPNYGATSDGSVLRDRVRIVVSST